MAPVSSDDLQVTDVAVVLLGSHAPVDTNLTGYVMVEEPGQAPVQRRVRPTPIKNHPDKESLAVRCL